MLATVEPWETRDIFPSAVLINSALKNIAVDPIKYFNKYKQIPYNKNIKLFERMIKDSSNLKENDAGYSLNLRNGIEFSSIYYKKLNSYKEWNTHNNR